jgi:hypothetical protein
VKLNQFIGVSTFLDPCFGDDLLFAPAAVTKLEQAKAGEVASCAGAAIIESEFVLRHELFLLPQLGVAPPVESATRTMRQPRAAGLTRPVIALSQDLRMQVVSTPCMHL